jgi:hypothetical protein
MSRELPAKTTIDEVRYHIPQREHSYARLMHEDVAQPPDRSLYALQKNTKPMQLTAIWDRASACAFMLKMKEDMNANTLGFSCQKGHKVSTDESPYQQHFYPELTECNFFTLYPIEVMKDSLANVACVMEGIAASRPEDHQRPVENVTLIPDPGFNLQRGFSAVADGVPSFSLSRGRGPWSHMVVEVDAARNQATITAEWALIMTVAYIHTDPPVGVQILLIRKADSKMRDRNGQSVEEYPLAYMRLSNPGSLWVPLEQEHKYIFPDTKYEICQTVFRNMMSATGPCGTGKGISGKVTCSDGFEAKARWCFKFRKNSSDAMKDVSNKRRKNSSEAKSNKRRRV